MQPSRGIGNAVTTKARITYQASKLQSIKAVHHKMVLSIKRYRRYYNLGILHKMGLKQDAIVFLKTMF